MDRNQLIKKYDIPVPRYTSYPTVPFWEKAPDNATWFSSVREGLKTGNGWSLYLHMPFCESLCTFCGCTKVITANHGKEPEYIDLLLREFELYLKNCPELATTPLKQFHFGGGSPTFFSAENLSLIVKRILQKTKMDTANFEGSIEIDPRRANEDQVRQLRELGFNRVSLGVQDFDAEVQRLINRTQPYELTAKITELARKYKYESVNFDLIYGLPKQTVASITESTRLVIGLRPDRIALYSLAVVPWIKPAQRLFKDEDLPKGEAKRELYEIARKMLMEAGYIEIGMDHFALPNDAMAVAAKEGRLHRNFMGYTDQRSDVLLGLGMSSISESPRCFHQNLKELNEYQAAILKGELPTDRGHVLTDEDQEMQHLILKLMTQFEVKLHDEKQKADVQTYLKPMIEDHLVNFDGLRLVVEEPGRPFIRNVCTAFDMRLRRAQPQARLFSGSI